ncbi:MAG TPA: GGDEF domain-containing protein [Candidatus Lustribacter sp.]|jgi:diguanylate cyclase (GGDEF)-like protein|nr:GGDEF domain-containing protein [Candidatus Lustribacter sp.]
MADNAPSPNPDLDRLTGTLTREALDRACEAAVAAAADGEMIAFGYIGMDGFLLLREAYGAVVTDHLLRETADRIEECLRPQDVVGRVERDEFMIVFRGLTSKFETLALASKLRTSIAEPMPAGKSEERLAPSCGIAQYPANGKTVDELRAAAKKSMLTLQIALRSASVAAAQENVNRARRNVEAANLALEEAEAAYEETVAVAAAAEEAATGDGTAAFK